MKCCFSKKKYCKTRTLPLAISACAAVLLLISLAVGGMSEESIPINALLFVVGIVPPLLIVRGCRYSKDEYVVVNTDSVLLRRLRPQSVEIVPLIVVTDIRRVDRVEVYKNKIVVYGANTVKKTKLGNGSPSTVEERADRITIDRIFDNEEAIIKKLNEMERK